MNQDKEEKEESKTNNKNLQMKTAATHNLKITIMIKEQQKTNKVNSN